MKIEILNQPHPFFGTRSKNSLDLRKLNPSYHVSQENIGLWKISRPHKVLQHNHGGKFG